MLTRCPNCGKQVEYSTTNNYRPFCSKKCRLLDFGDWIEEKNIIHDQDAPHELTSPEVDSDGSRH